VTRSERPGERERWSVAHLVAGASGFGGAFLGCVGSIRCELSRHRSQQRRERRER